MALVCKSCQRWIRWIPKKQADEPSTVATDGQCVSRKEIEKIDRQLTVITKAVLNMGMLRRKQRPEVYIADDLVNELTSNLIQDEKKPTGQRVTVGLSEGKEDC